MAEAHKVIFITLYQARGDGGERGTGPVIGIFETRQQALQYAAGKGWYGSDGNVVSTPAIQITWDYDHTETYLLSSATPITLTSATEQYEKETYERVIKNLSSEELRILNKLHTCQTSKT